MTNTQQGGYAYLLFVELYSRVGIFITINIYFMKRSKFFLGISTGILALVAFTAAKTAKFSNLKTAYYPAIAGGNCTVKATNPFFTVGTNPATNGSGAFVYTYHSAGSCVTTLYATEKPND
jgi:hypothetical protein